MLPALLYQNIFVGSDWRHILHHQRRPSEGEKKREDAMWSNPIQNRRGTGTMLKMMLCRWRWKRGEALRTSSSETCTRETSSARKLLAERRWIWINWKYETNILLLIFRWGQQTSSRTQETRKGRWSAWWSTGTRSPSWSPTSRRLRRDTLTCLPGRWCESYNKM